jgi:hypothetical protein
LVGEDAAGGAAVDSAVDSAVVVVVVVARSLFEQSSNQNYFRTICLSDLALPMHLMHTYEN